MPISVDSNSRLWPPAPSQYAAQLEGNLAGAAGVPRKEEVTDRKVAEDLSIRNSSAAGKSTPIECRTCKSRKYQDGSDDPGVSFKSAAHIDPSNSSTAVISHEQEHVRNETAKAAGEGKEVLSQTVTLETSVCPECGRVYTSGGKTRTVTRSKNVEKDRVADYYNKANPTGVAGNFSIRA